MTTRAGKSKTTRLALPDPPERHPDEVTSITYLHGPGTTKYLAVHLAHTETTLVTAELGLVATRQDRGNRVRYPDLLIAFGVDPGKYYEDNGYIVDEQGKPPDFVLEVASPSTATADFTTKRDFYEALGVSEYWRFDPSGDDHGVRLAGDRLVEGRYESVHIESAGEGVIQGYSAALDLFLQWHDGQLVFIDPATNASILTYEDQKARADSESARADNEAVLRRQAEERTRRLEEEILRLRSE